MKLEKGAERRPFFLKRFQAKWAPVRVKKTRQDHETRARSKPGFSRFRDELTQFFAKTLVRAQTQMEPGGR
jgi:hypothetical protein